LRTSVYAAIVAALLPLRPHIRNTTVYFTFTVITLLIFPALRATCVAPADELRNE
jgi:hypothetical protein